MSNVDRKKPQQNRNQVRMQKKQQFIEYSQLREEQLDYDMTVLREELMELRTLILIFAQTKIELKKKLDHKEMIREQITTIIEILKNNLIGKTEEFQLQRMEGTVHSAVQEQVIQQYKNTIKLLMNYRSSLRTEGYSSEKLKGIINSLKKLFDQKLEQYRSTEASLSILNLMNEASNKKKTYQKISSKMR